MKKHKLESSLEALGKVEKRLFRQWLATPGVNQREDVVRLFDWLSKNGLEPKEDAFAHVYPNAVFDDQQWRLLLSYLQRLVERFWAWQHWKDTAAQPQTDLLRVVRRRGLSAHFPEALKGAQQALERQPLRNADYYAQKGQILWEEVQFESVRQPGEARYLENLSRNADLLWIVQKLRCFCLQRAQQIIYRSAHALHFREEVDVLLHKDNLLEVPAVATWYYCLHMLEEPDNLAHFNHFKQLILAQDRLFDTDEIRDLHLLALNYCIRRANEGHRSFLNDIVDFYKDGLQKEYLLDNGVLSRFTYHNIVSAGLRTRAFDWVEWFIHAYRNTLERSYRDSSFNFNLARLEYGRQRYDAVLPLLQNSNYYDPLLGLSVRAIALKVYYETNEMDLLDSHLEAMKNYIRRKPALGYHRNYYLNLVHYTQKMMALQPHNMVALEKLREKIKADPMLSERDWLLEQLERLKTKI